LMGLPVYITCFFISYRFQYCFPVLCAYCFMIIGYGEVLFWSSLFGVLEASCT
jgi:hypothetical protein